MQAPHSLFSDLNITPSSQRASSEAPSLSPIKPDQTFRFSPQPPVPEYAR